jgi:hypothetical protein
MAAPKVTEREVRFARSFLKYGKFNQQNTYLLLAVIAWMRAEVGVNMKFMYNKNNPFNIRKSRFAYAYRRTNGNGSFAMFSSLDVAAKATVAFLSENATFGKYGPILAAGRRGASGDKALQSQAIDFLTAIAMSKWSSDHYGSADGNIATNRIIKLWAGITGQPIPAAWFQDTKKVVKRKVIPRQPRALQHVLPETNYLQPYAAANFYDERPHSGNFILPPE